MKTPGSLIMIWLGCVGVTDSTPATPLGLDSLERSLWHVMMPGAGQETSASTDALTLGGVLKSNPPDDFRPADGSWASSSEAGAVAPLIASLAAEGDDLYIEEGVCHGVISGGQYNYIQSGADFGMIGGGSDNLIRPSAAWGTIPGGYQNETAGECAFAAGHRAKARHDGTFVWADGGTADFVSTAPDQFLIRASGGVGVGLNVPQAQLHVAGGQGDLSRTEGDLKIGNANTRLKIGVALEGAQTGEVRLRAQGGSNRLLLGSGTRDDLRIQNGRVGIERFPTANAFEVSGAVSKSTPGHWWANSDRRLKKEIEPVRGALETLSKVRLIRFRYKDAYRAAHPEVEDRPYLNVVAQEFQEVFPHHVKSSGESGPGEEGDILQVDTYPLTIYSAAAIQELRELVGQKEAEIRALRRAVAELTTRLDALQQAGVLPGPTSTSPAMGQ